MYIGAEIEDADLTRPLPPHTVAEIRSALLEWKVVFFRGQSLDHAQHVAFARHFGAPTPGHVVFGGDSVHPEIYSVAKHRVANSVVGEPRIRAWTGWHTDITAAVNPPAASILRGVTVPPFGGDTLWTNLAVAYRHLSVPVQRFVESLRGVHRFEDERDGKMSREYEDRIRGSRLESEHPLVRVHPETGEKVLFVSPGFLQSIVGLAPRESDALLELLWEHVVRPEFTVRFRWEPGSIAFWDNRATAHLAPRDIFDTDSSASSIASLSSATCRGAAASETARRRLLYGVLKTGHRMQEPHLATAAEALRCELPRLLFLIEQLRRGRAGAHRRMELLRGRRNRAFAQLQLWSAAAHQEVDAARRARATRRAARHRRTVESAQAELSRVRVAPSNLEIAALLGIPKGTVDTGLYWLRRQSAADYAPADGAGAGEQQSA